MVLHKDNRKYIWIRLEGTVMHEFGHTLGLADLHEFGLFGRDYGRFLMKSKASDDFTVIPSKDATYLREVYQNHSPHAP